MQTNMKFGGLFVSVHSPFPSDLRTWYIKVISMNWGWPPSAPHGQCPPLFTFFYMRASQNRNALREVDCYRRNATGCLIMGALCHQEGGGGVTRAPLRLLFSLSTSLSLARRTRTTNCRKEIFQGDPPMITSLWSPLTPLSLLWLNMKIQLLVFAVSILIWIEPHQLKNYNWSHFWLLWTIISQK